jgi:hypothetical protein
MIFDFIVALVVVFLVLRKSGTFKRHLLAFVAAGVLSGIAAFASFELTHPYAGYASGARFDATLDSFGAWVLGLVAGFTSGAMAAKLFRGKVPGALHS